MLSLDDLFHRSLSSSFPQLIEKALTVLEDKLIRIGEGYQHYWFTCAASGLTLSETGTSLQAARQQATERICRLYCKILASQETLPPIRSPPPNRHGNVPDYTDRPTTVGINQVGLHHDVPMTAPLEQPMQNGGMPEPDPFGGFDGYGDLSGWEIADFWTFDPYHVSCDFFFLNSLGLVLNQQRSEAGTKLTTNPVRVNGAEDFDAG